MENAFLIFVSAALVNNFVLIKFLGLCPLMGASRQHTMAVGMGLATTFVLVLAAAASSALNQILLIPYQLEYLRTIVFIVIIASLVQLTEIVLKHFSPLLYKTLGIYLPLITTNCAVLGVALLTANTGYHWSLAIIYAFGAALGFALVLILFSNLRERLEMSDVPLAFRGTPIALITAGFMSVAFMGFSGLIKP